MVETTILSIDKPEAIQQAMIVLKDGGLVAFPTDTVYGLGALVMDGRAIQKIYSAKIRPLDKSIPVLIGAIEDLEKVAMDIPAIALELAARFWPGPLTLVIPKRPELPAEVTSSPGVGVRMPDHLLARNLLKHAGPMAVSSANLSGQPNPSTAEEVFEQLGGRIPLILEGGRTPGGIPSTVVDCLGPDIKILREGPISTNAIFSIQGHGF